MSYVGKMGIQTPLPQSYFTGEEGIGGRIKVRAADFMVEEIPLYQPCGEGEHLYLWVEKTDVAHAELMSCLRRHFGESRESFAARVACLSPAFTPLTHAHLRSVFGATGGKAFYGYQPSELRTLARRTRTELRTAVRWWRRIIGVVTPWSWLGTR